ncbi:MAG: PAS domain S-box protein [Myxococcota bacterium]
MIVTPGLPRRDLVRRLAEAEATIQALLSGQIDAVFDGESRTPLLVAAAQAALRQSEERYRGIVETASEGIATIDGEARLDFANQRLGDLLGCAPQHLVGRTLFELLPAAGWAAARHALERARQGAAAETELALTKQGGGEMWALVKTSPIRDGEGRAVGVLAMLTDVTSRREAEASLRASEAQYRQLVEATSDGIFEIDRDAVIVFVNRRLAAMLGYAPSELVGAPLATFADHAGLAAQGGAPGGPGYRLEGHVDTSYRHKDGSEIAVAVAGSGLFDPHGRHVGSMAVVRDVTEQKRLQSQLMVSDRMASVGALAAGVAHEINNPLAAVIGNLDCVLESLGGAERGEPWLRDSVRQPIVESLEAAQRVRFIVGDLKLFSRAPIEPVPGDADVEAVMESSLRMAWNEIRHRARVSKSFAQVGRVAVSEARLGQVFLNLLVNAAQALPAAARRRTRSASASSPTASASSSRWPTTARHRAGPPRQAVFDAFFTTKAVGMGTGLGLAICHRIVADMGGTLSVRSELGHGATFRVSLPCAALRATASAPAPSPPAEVAPAPRGRVLVVDDERPVGLVLKRALTPPHDVVVALGAAEALALCTSGHRFDVIICDLMMPGMTGMELFDEMSRLVPDQARRMASRPAAPSPSAARRFLARLERPHLLKPFNVPQVRALVDGYVRP